MVALRDQPSMQGVLRDSLLFTQGIYMRYRYSNLSMIRRSSLAPYIEILIEFGLKQVFKET